MTSMAATIKINGLQFSGNLRGNANKENVGTTGKFMMRLNNTSKGRFLPLVAACSHGGNGKWERTNGTKVNGVHVAEAPPLHVRKLLSRERAAEEALSTSLHGRFVDGGFVYGQMFVIRSYEIGPDKTASMETILNFLQETALNHVVNSGIGGNGFGATREMSYRKLIWVVTRIQVQVQRYSKWGDEIEVDTWVDAAGKNGMKRDWIIRDHHTKEIITRATSTWVIMNRETRRLSKMPEQVRKEISPFYLNRTAIPIEETDCEKIDKLTDDKAERIQSGLAPRWNDMDANQHVNNVRYISWILECLPVKVLEDFYMTSMTLEFRRECTQSDLLESMVSSTSRVIGKGNNNSINRKPGLQYTHLVRLADGKADVVRARTEWNSKRNLQ